MDNKSDGDNSWKGWSRLVISQLKFVIEEVKDLKELRQEDREEFIATVKDIKSDMRQGLQKLQSDVALMQQAHENKISKLQDEAEERAVKKANRRTNGYALGIGVLLIIFEILTQFVI